MSNGRFEIFSCDRCGHQCQIPADEADKMSTRLPKEWSYIPSLEGSKTKYYDLCHTCTKSYQKFLAGFMDYYYGDK